MLQELGFDALAIISWPSRACSNCGLLALCPQRSAPACPTRLGVVTSWPHTSTVTGRIVFPDCYWKTFTISYEQASYHPSRANVWFKTHPDSLYCWEVHSEWWSPPARPTQSTCLRFQTSPLKCTIGNILKNCWGVCFNPNSTQRDWLQLQKEAV